MECEKILDARSSILIGGPARSGKTSLLRALAESLSLKASWQVLVFDQFGEVGGMGIKFHMHIGFARRAALPPDAEQGCESISELIRTHLPRALVIDES